MLRAPMAATLMATCLVAAGANAADAASDLLREGRRVRLRLTSPNAIPWTGTVQHLDNEALLFLPDGKKDARRIRFEEIRRLEVSRGRHDASGSGALIGLTIGAVAGFVLGMSASCGDAGRCNPSFGDGLKGAAVIGGTTGLLGVVIGSLSKVDRWQEVPTPSAPMARVSVLIAPIPGGARARLAVAF